MQNFKATPVAIQPMAGATRLAELSLRQNIGWTLVGRGFYAGCQWGILVLLARLTTPEIVGQFVLATAITAPVLALANLQLRGVQATDALKEYQFTDYLALRIVTTIIAFVIIVCVATVGGYGTQVTLVILAVGLAKAIESFNDVIFGLFQQHERMDRIAYSLIVKGSLSLPAIGVVLYLTQSVTWATLALATVWGLTRMALSGCCLRGD